MPNPIKGKTVEVDVLAHPPGSPEPYTIDWRFQGDPSQGNTAIRLPPGSGSHDMIFTLVDNSGKGLRFKPAADEAMWVRHGKGCPSGKGSANGQITYVSVSNGGMTLTVNDDNSGNPARLHYMLRFDPDPNVFDPEIRNGGGGGFAKSASITSAAAGAVIGAGAAFLMSDAAGATNLLFGLIVGAVAGYVLWAVAGAMR